MNKKSTLNKGVFTAGVVGAMVSAPYVADELNLTQDTAGETGFSLADAISMKEAAAFAGGTGTAEDPYLISTSAELKSVANSSNHFKLVNNISLNNELWVPISSFRGVLDGNGYEITDLNVNATTNREQAGLFASLGGTVKNLTINHATVVGTGAYTTVGVLAGTASGVFDNVHIKNATVSGTGSLILAGGVFGTIGSGTISNVTFQGSVTTDEGEKVGGIAAYIGAAKALNISATGTVSNLRTSVAKTLYTGGLFGHTEGSKLSNLVSNVNVIGNENTGGLIGIAATDTKVVRAIAYGRVEGLNPERSEYIGGLVGKRTGTSKFRLMYAYNSYVGNGESHVGKAYGDSDKHSVDVYSNTYFAIEGDYHSDNVVDVIDDSEVYKKSTYQIFGFDFDKVWDMTENSTTPVLKIQNQIRQTKLSATDIAKYSFAGGSGTISDPFLISTIDDIRLMKNHEGNHFKLINDIDLGWSLIEPMGALSGSFDGNGHKLMNLNINTTEDYASLFGNMTAAFVKDLTIENADVISTEDYVGVLAGRANGTILKNIRIIGEVNVSGGNYVGGAVGYYSNQSKTLKGRSINERIEVHGNISGTDHVGGVIGSINDKFRERWNYGVIFSEVSSHTNVVGEEYVGGVVGRLVHGNLKNVISYGDVVGKRYVGGVTNLPNGVFNTYDSNGVTGTWSGPNQSLIENAIVYGSATGASNTALSIGGILGIANAGSMKSVFAYNSKVGTAKAGTMSKAIGELEVEDKDAPTLDGVYQFHTILGDASVGYVDAFVTDEQVTSTAFYKNKTDMAFGHIWTIVDGEHPTLSFAPFTAEHTFTEEEQAGAQFAGGSGSIEDPFLISKPEHLRLVSKNLNAHFKLANDIDMDWSAWTSADRIGTSTSLEFTGTFDGNGYAIKNLNIVGTETYTALFGYISETGVIKNLKIQNAEASSTKSYLGILVAQSLGSLENIEITGDVTMNPGADYAGIVAAKFDGDYDAATGEGLVKNIYVEGKINGDGKDYLGAFGTITGKAEVNNVVVDVDVTGAQRVGSFAGNIAGTGTYKSIIAKGDVTGDTYAGGYAGYIAGSTHEKIFAYGAVKGIDSGSASIGGVIGYASSASATIKGMYAMNPSVQIGNAETVGAAIGRSTTSTSFSPQFVSAISTLASSGHSTHVSTTITGSTYNQSSTYARHGFMFDETDGFAIDAGGAPYLTAFPEKITFNGSTFEFSSLVNANELIAIATTAIDLAEGTLLQTDIEAAQIAVNSIPDSALTQKNQLQTRLNGVRDYAVATKAVDFAVRTLKQGNVNDARALVNKLSSESQRNGLNAQLDALSQTIIEQDALAQALEIRVSEAELMKTRELISAVTLEVDTMLNSGVKLAFLNRLDNVTAYLDTKDELESAVNNLEKNIGASNARSLYKGTSDLAVSASTTMGIEPYAPRIAQAYIDIQIAELYEADVLAAQAAVVKAEQTPTPTNVNAAQLLIDVLPNIKVKEVLQERLDVVKAQFGEVELAKQAVEKAEATLAQVDYDAALLSVNKLVEGADKTALLNRLENVLKQIQQAEKVAQATIAVEKAESTKTQADIDSARTLVNALLASVEKTDLTARLDALQKAINDEKAALEALSKAQDAVSKVEISKTQTDMDSARTLVNALPNGAEKTALINRLDVVQAIIDASKAVATATEAVVKAETTKTQTDVDSARTLVNTLPNGTDKTNLTTRLDAVQKAINDAKAVATATAAVVKAEGSKAQADVDSARTLVNALPDGADKTALTARLDAIQTEIDVQAQLESLILEATQAVVKAEGSKLQTDVDDARILVNGLPDGADKTNLTNRLNTVQAAIDAEAEKQAAIEEATKAVVKAEGSKLQADVDSARTLVNALPDGAEKTALTERLDAVQKAIDDAKAEAEKQQALEEATKAVEKAETTKTQVDVDNARTLVNALPDGAEKTALTERLDAVQAEIDRITAGNAQLQAAKEAVSKAESTKSQTDVDNARTLVNALPDGAEKTALTDRLDVLQAEIDKNNEKQAAIDEATKAVVKAEGSKSQADVDDARTLVNALPDGAEKTALTERLDAVQTAINDAKAEAEKQQAIDEATKAVVKAEGSKSQADVDDARTLVNALPDGADKTALTERLDAVQKAIDDAKSEAQKQKAIEEATQAVVKAEGTKSQADVDDARTLVNALPDGAEKTALTDRLDAVQAEIDKDVELENLVTEATTAVEKAENTKTQGDINDAREKVKVLPDGEVKNELTDRLDKIQAEIDAKIAEQEADNALYERIKTEVLDINNNVLNYVIKEAQYAETLVTLEGLRQEAKAIKDETKRNEVNLLIDSVVDLIALLQSIEAGDTSKIDNLPNSVVKDKLKNDLLQKDLLADATSKVVKAEGTLDDSDIRNAQAAVDKLKEGADKQALQARLDALNSKAENNRLLNDAKTAVEKAELSPTNLNINSAQNKVNALPDGADKDALQARIDAIHEKLWQEALAKATKAVEEAEEKRVTYFVNQAKSAVTALKASPEKEALEKRIADLEKDILTQAELDRLYNFALQAVEKAEGSTLEFLLISAQRAVDKVSDNDNRKAGLQERLNVLYKAKALRDVEAAVARAELSPSDKTIEAAQTVINQLDKGDARDGFQTRLDAVIKQLDDERYAAAEREVVKAETNKTRESVEVAQEKVDLVKDSDRKKALQERLDAILEWIEYMENLDGKFQPGDNIVEIAKTVKDENVRNYLVNWATAIDTAERYYSVGYSTKPANALLGIPESVLTDVRYQPLINEMKTRTDVINKSTGEFSRLRTMVVKAAYNAIYTFENDRTQANYDAALSTVNALKTAELGDNTRKTMLERLNRIQVKK